MSRKLMLPSILWLSFLLSCQSEKQRIYSPIVGAAPAFHRLTEVQVNNAIGDIFSDDGLPYLALPPEVSVHGFTNNEMTRAPTPYLVESLQRGVQNIVQNAIVDAEWLACSFEEASLECGYDALDYIHERAWRRPIIKEERDWIHGLFADWYTVEGFEAALAMSLSVVLQSPEFLYLVEHGDPSTVTADEDGHICFLDQWEIASRLSFFLTDTMPDTKLRMLAEGGELQNPDVVREQARRLLRSDASRLVVRRFFQQWLDHGVGTKINPDMEFHMDTVLSDEEMAYFEEILVNGTIQERIELDEYWGSIKSDIQFAFQAEFNLYVDSVVFGEGTLDAFLTGSRGYVSERTAEIYGVGTGNGPSYQFETENYHSNLTLHEVELPDEQRSGFLTQGLYLAGHSHPVQPAPVLRGVFIRERLLCIPPASPPDDIPAIGESGSGEWTTNRERYEQHTSDPSCAACHQSIDGLGFPFENYDVFGAWRDTDNGAPVDATGVLTGTDFDGRINNGVELVDLLASSAMVHDCMVTNLYRYGMHKTEVEQDAVAIANLQQLFWDGGGSIPNMLVQFVSSDAFLMRREPKGGNQ